MDPTINILMTTSCLKIVSSPSQKWMWWTVVGNLKNNKSPGWGELTAEFYKEFWEILRPILFNNNINGLWTVCHLPNVKIKAL